METKEITQEEWFKDRLTTEAFMQFRLDELEKHVDQLSQHVEALRVMQPTIWEKPNE